ncbi:MAG TPA: GNAT family N-acetyltransferase [Solirubrobacterales bacterium]|nr:GNAT family N-acetyltransferase [Solirubrobacterales bacterium]
MAEERRIVELGVGDVDLVEGLWKEMVAHHRDVIGRAAPVREPDAAWRIRRAQYVAWMEAGDGFLFLVPGEGALEVPLGYAFLRIGDAPATLDLGERVGDLESLSVTAAARGMGIGTMLIAHCRERLRERGVRWWTVTAVAGNDGAVALYEREGFRLNSHNLLAAIE